MDNSFTLSFSKEGVSERINLLHYFHALMHVLFVKEYQILIDNMQE